MIDFQNTYAKLPAKFYQKIKPAKFKDPKLIAFNHKLASELGLETENLKNSELAKIFSGQTILPTSEPLAMAYAAHQFGHFVPQLGDGRAHLLGEIKGFDIQLKGSGQTMFSRRGDGRSALGPVIREYILSEAMSALGTPTTRALAAVVTGEYVERNGVEPGGVFTRVAPSHIRVGTFQYFANLGDIESIQILMDYAINRHYQELNKIDDLSLRAISFFDNVAKAQAKLVAKWLSLGFIHGVMNTDNFSIGGFSIDYGPCAFMDEFKKDKVFSSIDRNSRYAYNNQIQIAKWNLMRLADCLLPLIDENEEKAISKIEELIPQINSYFDHYYLKEFCLKFAIKDPKSKDNEIIADFLSYLENEQLDFTLSFRNLAKIIDNDESYFKQTLEYEEFKKKWLSRVENSQSLNLVNPIYIPRNHNVEKVIQDCNNDDYKSFELLVKILEKPFDEVEKYENFSLPPKPEERVTKTFCGT